MTIKQTIRVDVQSNLSDEAKLAKAIKDNLQEAAKVRLATSTASAKMAAAGGTTGAQSSLARGVGGLTGAAGRDFAAQQQGLGGLVRLYATYAANLFAVSAGFRALSGAMDTTNMVKGLDQLGAATGRNLGSIAKRLANLSDGAISLRESMQAVAQSTSAGMTSKNIERMGMVAKNASLALGVAMPDAIGRISRGITKLEPELLDELGIMTKIEPAVNAYARSVGKAAGQLTDFERRQAFANAVLLEGEQKFGEIADLAANPYDRLLSTLKNVAQGGLEVLNKVLDPIVNLLASSPTALVGVLGVLGISLLKQALPALGEYKAGLASVAETASQLSTQKAADAKLAREQINKQIIDQVELRANKEIAAVDSAQKKIEALQAGNLDKRTAAYKILQKASQDVDNEDFKKLEASALSAEKKGLTEKAAAIREVSATIKSSQDAEIALVKTKADLTQKEEAAASSRFTVYGARVKAAEAAEKDTIKKALISNAAYNASLIGVSGATKIFNDELEKSGLKLTGLEKTAFKAKAGFATLTGAVTAFGAALNQALFIIGIIVTVLGILDSIFSTNTKQLSAFNSAVDELESSTDNVSRTLEKLEKQGGFSKESIKGIFAMSNAMTELTDSTLKAVDAAKKAREGMGLFSRTKQNISGFLGFGNIEKDLAKSLGTSVTKSIEILTASGQGKEAQETFKNILGVDSLDIDTVTEAVSKLSETGLTNLTDALTKSNASLGNSSTKLQDFKTAVEANKKAFDEFILSTANTNPMFRLGNTMTSVALKMSAAATGGVRELTAAFEDLAKNPQNYAMFGEAFTSQLVNVKDGFLEQANAVAVYKTQIDKLNIAIEKQVILDKKQAQSMGVDEYGRNIGGSDSNKVKTLQAQKTAIQTALEAMPIDQIEKGRKLFVQGLDSAFAEGSRLISLGLGQAAEKASLSISKARAEGLTGERRAVELGKLQQKDLDIQLRQIDASIGLLLSNERLKTSIDLLAANQALVAAREKAIASQLPSDGEAVNSASNRLANLEAYQTQISAANAKNIQFKPSKDTSVGLQALMLSLQSIIAPQLASRKEVQGQKEAGRISTIRATAAGIAEDTSKTIEQQQRALSYEKDRLDLLTKIQGISSQTLVEQEYTLKTKQLDLKQQQELAKLYANLVSAVTTNNKEEMQIASDLYVITRDKFDVEEQAALKEEKRLKLSEAGLEDQARSREKQLSFDKINTQINIENLTRDAEALDIFSKLVGFSSTFVENSKLSTDSKKQEQQYALSMLDIDNEREKYIENYTAMSMLLDENNETDKVIQQNITTELTRQLTLLSDRQQKLKEENDTLQLRLDKTREINDLQERFNILTQLSANSAESLSSVFGGLGDTLGDMVKAFTANSIAVTNYAKAMKGLDNLQQGLGEDSEQFKAIELERSKLIASNARRELSANISQIAGVKALFGEKTKLGKAFGVVEKALAAERLVTDVKALALQYQILVFKEGALALDFKAMGTKVLELAVLGKAAILSALKAPPPLGFIAGAAMAAIVASLIGGGSSVSGIAAPTAAQQNEVNGSAMGYDDQGKLVQTNAGVFGDTKAKSESVVNSLEIIKDNSVAGLSYDNKMLRALESVAEALTGTARALYSIPGLVTGSAFGTQAGTTSGGSFLGFGGISTSKEIIDAGIKLVGTFEEIRLGAKGAINLYEATQTIIRDSGTLGFGAKTTTINATNIKGLEEFDPKAKQSIMDAFEYSQTLLLQVGELAGVASTVITDQLSTLKIQGGIVSLKGLTGEEFTKALNSVFSNVMDQASAAIFTTFKDFARFGEGMLETVVRVVDTNTKIKQLLSNMGIGTDSVTFIVSEALSDAAGGLTNFLDQSKIFSENFLTQAERLVPVQKAVTAEMARLGYANVTTRAQFKDLVQGLKTTTKEGIDTYQALMNVQEGFIQVTEAVIDTTTVLEDNLRTVYENRKKELQDLISGYGQVSKTLTDLKTSLLMGAESTLSPSQKYALAKTAYEAAVLGTQSTDPKIQLAAMQQLSTTAKDFLAISRVLYASSAQYVKDFDSVLDTIDKSIIAADPGLQTAQDQLTALESMVGTLIKIDAAVNTSTDINQGIKDYLTTKFTTELYDVIIAGMGEDKLTTATGIQEVTDALSKYDASATQKVLQAYKDTFGRTGSQIDVEGLENWVKDTLAKGYFDQAAFQSPLSKPLIDLYGKETYDAVVEAYASIGRAGGIGTRADQIDLGGLEYWMQQMAAGTLDLRAFAAASDIGQQVIKAYESVYGVPASAIDIAGLNYWIKRSTEAGGALPQSEFERPLVDRLITTYGQSVYDTITKAYADIGRTGFGSAATQIDVGGAEWWMNQMKQSGIFDQLGFTFAAAPHARGGIASGWSLVGEEGPELVNFTNPGRVYAANDTAMMMGNQSNGALLEEIRNLRMEVQELRKEQNSQTGAIITSNYNANLIASENIGEAMKESAQQAEWATRSAVALK